LRPNAITTTPESDQRYLKCRKNKKTSLRSESKLRNAWAAALGIATYMLECLPHWPVDGLWSFKEERNAIQCGDNDENGGYQTKDAVLEENGEIKIVTIQARSQGGTEAVVTIASLH
jgi:hypothetical protein